MDLKTNVTTVENGKDKRLLNRIKYIDYIFNNEKHLQVKDQKLNL